MTVIGKGLTCTNGTTSLIVRLDGQPLQNISCVGNGDRQLTATVPSTLLGSARRFALDVVDLSGNVTNAEDFTVEQSVDVSSTGCPSPEPSGVAIDPQQNIAAVSLFGCNSLALINMTQGKGNTVGVGANPIGVAVIPRLHVAVVANNGGSGTASIVDEVQQTVTQTVTTGSGPIGAAADEATGEVAIANSVANTVTVVNVVTGGTSNISTGQRPVAVGFNYVNHQMAVAASSGNSVGISSGAAGSVSQTFGVSAPTSVIYDPVTTDCGSNSNGTTTNTTGCFIVNSSTGNSVNVIDPVASIQYGIPRRHQPDRHRLQLSDQHAGQHQYRQPYRDGSRFPWPKDPSGPDFAAGHFGEFQSGAQSGFSGSAAVCVGYSAVYECRGHRGHGERARLVCALAALEWSRPTPGALECIASSTGKGFALPRAPSEPGKQFRLTPVNSARYNPRFVIF